MKHYKRIETSREIRLWLTNVVTPIAATIIATSPEARTKIKNVTNGAANVLRSAFRKK